MKPVTFLLAERAVFPAEQESRVCPRPESLFAAKLSVRWLAFEYPPHNYTACKASGVDRLFKEQSKEECGSYPKDSGQDEDQSKNHYVDIHHFYPNSEIN